MALSGLFLMVFLLQHFAINITSVFSETIFNQFSHFMGTNTLVQFVLQPILIFGVIFHFVMGFVLDIQNRRARGTRYAVYKGNANASWVSRNMLKKNIGSPKYRNFDKIEKKYFIKGIIHSFLLSYFPHKPLLKVKFSSYYLSTSYYELFIAVEGLKTNDSILCGNKVKLELGNITFLKNIF